MQTYAPFWQRLGASLVDTLVLWPVGYFAYAGDSKALLMLDSTASSIIVAAYAVVLHARFGQTAGKWLMGIRVVDVDGGRIGWRRSVLRSSVDILLSVVFLVAYGSALVGVPDAQFYGVDPAVRDQRIFTQGVYVHWIAPAIMVWTFSEVVVMLFNERRRSVHDFIAGTVVVATANRSAEATA